ncbi:MAG: hypothetical protein K940chlam1_01104 [Candidatus Anoxychlamydiales bacterium]|nr:hypothetical protein [Candidatus Anoxychlamydiales bacterium]NGX36418.1 hypothetical protein [Candidatus Anoxychlamydiales bacterium]
MSIKYLKVIEETPILNTENFESIFGGEDKKTLNTDEKGHVRAIEFIALVGMLFEIVKKCKTPFIYQVKCDFYKSSALFIDSRFTNLIEHFSSQKLEYSLDPKTIIEKLKSMIGSKYVWGGNFSLGIAKLLKYYPSKEKLSDDQKDKWSLKGVDCSGLLFEVTNGYTPRNTSHLLDFKESLKIENLSPLQISKLVKPLDLLVYKGHVVVILDNDFAIESRENFGVIKTPILDRLKEIHLTKKPSNIYQKSDDYVIRRWV